MTRRAAPVFSLLILVMAVGCTPASVESTASAPASSSGPLPQGSEPVTLEPTDFVATIDHPYWPMEPGTVWIYNETDAEGNELQIEFTVTDVVAAILEIGATVVHEEVTMDGALVEDTVVSYAQDTAGNLWILGEETTEYEDGVAVGTSGTWVAGVDGAQPGIVLPADPQVGMRYRHGYYAGEAEDRAEVLSVDEQVDVPAGSFEGALQTEESSPLDPDVVEHKFYALGQGPILVVGVAGGESRTELISIERP